MSASNDDVSVPTADDEDHQRRSIVGSFRSGVLVLLADDDEDDRLLTSDALREAGIFNELRFVTNGEELIDYLYHRGKYMHPTRSPRPGLLLLDLNMTRKDGREALREIKSDPALRSIPVVVLTTSKSQDDIDYTYSVGANAFITKPASFEDLVKAMKATGEYWFQVVKLPTEPAES